MKNELITHLHRNFESCAHEHDGMGYWNARDLGYTDWRNLLKIVDKAMEACANAGQRPADHFVDVNKMIADKSRRTRR
ncbi:MAG: hypothetical protein U1A73_05795 [Pseudomonas sp.]|nr:hypothetical protein [Xanthomonadaceae bacterium]MDP2184833.1 hypothetical protein [Xanthomonadales bacterium]MDZ4117168.1 hypothetical protein [Xanthomonadaceae bacterium]MDZ4324518.1 hypothetical protein [Pseudomonas sp.]